MSGGGGGGREKATLTHHASPTPGPHLWDELRSLHWLDSRETAPEDWHGWSITPGEALRVPRTHCSISDQLVPWPSTLGPQEKLT